MLACAPSCAIPPPAHKPGGSDQPERSYENPWEALLEEAEGFGAHVTGGAGGQLITVTSLDRVGPGTLREALGVPGKTWIRFTPGLQGTIALHHQLSPGSDTTIDGRGADITITRPVPPDDGSIFWIQDIENLIIAYLKLESVAHDCLRFWDNVDGVWLHHLSLQKAGDELVDIARRTTNVTISWSRFFNSKFGVLVSSDLGRDYISRITFHHNYFDGISERTPLLGWGMAHVYNSYTARWTWGSTTSAEYSQLYWEKNIADADGASDRKAVYSGGSASDIPMGNVRSVGPHLLMSRARVEEKNSCGVFDPREYYSYQADDADEALRMRLIEHTGWQDVPFPETPE